MNLSNFSLLLNFNVLPKDPYGIPVMLAEHNGRAVPIKVNSNGMLMIDLKPIKYELVKSMNIDLTIARDKKSLDISFDSFAVIQLDSSFYLYIGNKENEDKKILISQCISIDVSSENIYISNSESEGKTEILFFKIKE